MLFGWKVDDSPVLQKGVDPDDRADIPWEVSPAHRWRQIFFGILAPHGNHKVSIKFVQGGCFPEEFIFVVLLQKELGECFLLYGVDLVDVKPPGERWHGDVEGWLDEGSVGPNG